MKRILPMRRLRQFISLVTLTAFAVVPFLSVGCNEPSGGTPSTGQTTTTKTETTTTTSPKGKKEKKKKTTTTSESGSTTGAGVTPPVKSNNP
jgi:hypothetical protein